MDDAVVVAPRPLRLADEVFAPLPESQRPPRHTVQVEQGGRPNIETLGGFLNTLNEKLFTSEPFGRYGYYTSRGEGFAESIVNPASRNYYERYDGTRALRLAYTEEQTCLYWAYMASTLFYENEEVTEARLREVDAMERVLRHVSKGEDADDDDDDDSDDSDDSEGEDGADGVNDAEGEAVQRNQRTLAFLQELSIPDNNWDGEGLRATEGGAFGEGARFFWVYYLTCYCLLLNAPHSRRRKPDVRTDGWGRKMRLNYDAPPGLYKGVESPEPLVRTPEKLENTLYHLQYWFDQHLADSPVTKLAYGISELCGLRKAASNPALLLYDTDRDGTPQLYFDNARVRRQIVRKAPGEAGEEVPCPDDFVTQDDLFGDDDGNDADGPAMVCRMETDDEAIARRGKLVDLMSTNPDDLQNDEFHDTHNRERLIDLWGEHYKFRQKFLRFLFVFDDVEDWVDINAKNEKGDRMYSTNMKYRWDDDERYVPALHDRRQFWEDGRLVLRADDRVATRVTDEEFQALIKQSRSVLGRSTRNTNPVAVDLYKPLPRRYASLKAGYPDFAWDPSKAGAFYQAQLQFWKAYNANPRYVFAQQLRTYYFDPYLASPERLVADLTYWHYRKLEAIAAAQSEMRFDDDEAEMWDLPYYIKDIKTFYGEGRLEAPNADVLTPYTTKLALEVDDWQANFEEYDQPSLTKMPRRYFLRPFRVPLEVESEQGERVMEKRDNAVYAWTEFQVRKWYRDAEYHATMHERQVRGDAPPPATVDGNEYGYDFERYTTKDKGARERAESDRLYDLRRARERAEYERDLREYGEKPVRCTPFDNIGVAESGMADVEKDDPDTLHEGGMRYEGDYNSSDDDSYPPFKYKGKTYTFFDDDEETLSYKERQLIKKGFPEAGVTVFGDAAYEKALREALEAKRQMLEYERIAPIYTPSNPPPPILDKKFWDDLDEEKRRYEQERRAQAAAARALGERRRERRPRPYGESVVDEVFAKLTI